MNTETPPTSLLGSLLRPIDSTSLAAFRILFGLMMFVGAMRFFGYGWIEEFYIRPQFFFTFYKLDWIQPLGTWGTYGLFVLFALSALLIALGWMYRWSVVCFFCVFTYIECIDKTNYLNHYYFVSIVAFLMIWMPLADQYSLDAIRKKKRAQPIRPTRSWMLWTLRLQLGIVYFFAGVAKLNADWLLRGEPLQTWLRGRTDFPVLGGLFAQPYTPLLMSWGGALFDLSIAGIMLSRRARPWAYLVILGFHFVTWLLFPIGLFPWMMIGFTLLFFDPDWPRMLYAKMRGQSERTPHLGPPKDLGSTNVFHASTNTTQPTWKEYAIFALLGIHFCIQLALPLRGHLYPGHPNWTEQGFRFSWKVMLIEKNGQIDFFAYDPISKKRWTIPPRQYLTALQIKMMSTQPDMILAFAHRLAHLFRQKGYPHIEIRARAFASLNGRRTQLLIDPKVDLAKQPRGFAHKTWIVPLRPKSK